MSDPTYTQRHLDVAAVKSLDDGVHFVSGWSFGPPEEHKALFELWGEYLIETGRGNQITGAATIRRTPDGLLVDQWLWHKSDQELEREHAEWVADLNRRREETLEAHREDWARREQELPGALRRRLERFRANGGHEFDREGWGYELVICELAVLYAASGQVDDDNVTKYSRREGTSGNQHDFAKALSRGLGTDDPADEDAVANSVSALSPITGDADYSEAGKA